MTRYARVMLVVFAGGLVALQAQAVSPIPSREDQVRRFVAAFNSQDVAAMVAMVTDDVEWLSIEGLTVGRETSGKAQLSASMTAYFKGCPTCRSALAGVTATRDRVATVEVATWTSAQGPREQRGLAVYEFLGPLIRRVYYFPVER